MRKFKSFIFGFSIAATILACCGAVVGLFVFIENSYGAAGPLYLLAFVFCTGMGALVASDDHP